MSQADVGGNASKKMNLAGVNNISSINQSNTNYIFNGGQVSITGVNNLQDKIIIGGNGQQRKESKTNKTFGMLKKAFTTKSKPPTG